MSKAERLRAAADLLEAEAAFAAKKPNITDEDRHVLRTLRQAYRENHRTPISEGAQPAAIANKAKAKDVN